MAEFKHVFLQLRTEKGFSQREIASELHVSKATIGMWETGKRYPGPEKYEEIADYFNVDMDYIYGRSNIKRKVKYMKLDKDMVLQIESEERGYLLDVYKNFGYSTYKLVCVFRKLPDETAKVIEEHIDFLAHKYSLEYKTEQEMEKIFLDSCEMPYEEYLNANNIILNAAHMDEDATEKDIQHDNDIMNNDDEWK